MGLKFRDRFESGKFEQNQLDSRSWSPRNYLDIH